MEQNRAQTEKTKAKEKKKRVNQPVFDAVLEHCVPRAVLLGILKKTNPNNFSWAHLYKLQVPWETRMQT